MNIKSLGLALVTMMVLSLLATSASAADWPTFQQNNYNNGVISDNVASASSQEWKKTMTGGGWLGWESAPIIADNTIYEVYCNGSVFAFNLTNGNDVWANHEVGGSGMFELSVPAYDSDDGYLYVALSAGNSTTNIGVHALDVTDGDTVWSNTSGLESGHQFNTGVKYDSGEEAIYLGSVHMKNTWESDEGNFYCLDADTGEVKWTYTNNDCGYYWATPAIIGDYVVLGDDDGVIRSFNKSKSSDGTPVDSVTTSDGSIRSAIVYDGSGYIYFTTTGGSVMKYSFNSATGDIGNSATASYDTGTRTTTTPAVTDDHVFVTDDSGTLSCYTTSLSRTDYEDNGAAIKASPVVATGASTYNHVYYTRNGGYAECDTFRKSNGRSSTGATIFGESDYTLQGVAIVDGYIVYGNDAKELFCYK